MKRQIKVRGKRIDNGEWVYGCPGLGFSQEIKYIMPSMYFATRDFGEQTADGTPIIDELTAIGGYYPVKPETVGQYVGTINGKDIYEGDYDQEGNMVQMCETCFGWQFYQIDIPTHDIMFCHNCEGNFILQDLWNDFKPIGNIHQNPELLK